MELPKGYIKGVPRVSDIVSFVYPFEGNSKERYRIWLDSKGIDESEYLGFAQKIGTYIHQLLEDKINGIESKLINKGFTYNKEIELLIKNGYKYIESLYKRYKLSDGREYIAEPVLLDKDKRFQGSSDLVLLNRNTNEVIIIDRKTFGIAKSQYDNVENKYKKPYDKLKKGRLQFSLYAETFRQKGFKIKGIKLVYLHKTKAYEYDLELYSTSELDEILHKFANRKNNLIINNNSMDYKIEILEPTKQYGNVKLTLDLATVDNGKTEQENIESFIAKAKWIADKLK